MLKNLWRAEIRRGSSLCLWYWRPKNFRTSSSKITGNENVITSTLAHLGTSWHIVAHRGTSCQEALRTNHGHAVPFVILCASLVAFEIWWESIPERESTKYTRKFLKRALFALLHQPSCPIMPVQWANGKHFCQERSIQNDLGTSRTLSDSTPHPWIDINSIKTRKLQNCQTPINTLPTLQAFKSSSFFCTSLPAQSKTQSGQQQSLDATQKNDHDDSQIMAIRSDIQHTANAKSPHKLSLNMFHHIWEDHVVRRLLRLFSELFVWTSWVTKSYTLGKPRHWPSR